MTDSKFLITPIPTLKDNYVWTLTFGDFAIVIDPGEAQPILDFLKSKQLTLKAILITHHHRDHIGGVAELVKNNNVSVYAPFSEKIFFSTKSVKEGMELRFEGFPLFSILEIPGHTLDHIAYYFDNHLFCGDTLFSAGCGKVFEGTHEQMYQSLKKLKSLPATTQIYCGHEYTLQNLYFAKIVEPANEFIQDKIIHVSKLREKKVPSLPSRLEEELKINPFLRCDVPTVIAAAENYAGKTLENSVAVFSVLREWKNDTV